MAPRIATNPHITPPSVTKVPCEDLKESEPLPLGIRLTGGQKLRDKGLTGKGVRVAVIDSGVDETHPGFGGQVKQQLWFRAGSPLEEDDHGTHVAGTIHMMAPDAEIYDYRVFGAEGSPVEEAIVISIFEAVFDGCHVINMSLGGRFPNANIRSALQYAESHGVVVVCAAGNSGDDNPLTNERGFPAMWEEAISVGAVSKKEGLPVAYFSNSNPHVDFAGIGVDVVSFKPGGGYQLMSGTSMACPHVAGLIAALMSSHGKGKKKDEFVRKYLKKHHVVDIDKVGPDTSTGVGFLTYLDKHQYKEIMKELFEKEPPAEKK